MECFLVARDKTTNDYQIVSISGKKKNSLEEIDLFTTSFKDSEELTKNIELEIEKDNLDYFIFRRKKYNKNLYVKIDDVLYEDSKTIRPIAKSFLKDEENALTDKMLNEFCFKMETVSTFFDMIISNGSNVSKKFINYFIGNRYKSVKNVKYNDGGWARKTYSLIRNIEDSFKKFNKYNKNMEEDKQTITDKYRHLLDKKLLDETDPLYQDGQVEMFDLFEDSPFELNDKLIEALDVIERLDKSIFVEDNKKIRFLHKLSFDNEEFILKLKVYINTKEKLTNDNPRIKKHVKDLRKEIITDLNNNKELLDSFYNWTLKYNDYLEKIEGENNGYKN